MFDDFEHTLITESDEEEQPEVSLFGAGAAGITLLTRSRYDSLPTAQTTRIVSPDDNRDRIYYAADELGTQLSNPLAHELFGHYWLSLKGGPWSHPSDSADPAGILEASRPQLEP